MLNVERSERPGDASGMQNTYLNVPTGEEFSILGCGVASIGVPTGREPPPGFDQKGEEGTPPYFFVSVAAKRLRARVRSGPDRVGAGQWTVVSGEKNGGSKPERGEPFPTGSESSIGAPFGAQGKRARIGFNKHDERMAYLT